MGDDMKIEIKVGRKKHIIQAIQDRKESGWKLTHNGETVSYCGSGVSKIDRLRSYADQIVYSALLS